MLEINKNTIRLAADPYEYWSFGSDQMNISYPIRFPTVTIALDDSHALNMRIDAMRVEAGCKPMFPENYRELDPEDWDDQGWYNFYATIYRLPGAMTCAYIEGIVEAGLSGDNEQVYQIDLNGNEQAELIKVLDELLSDIDTSCDKLLEEARQEMIELEGF